MPRGIPNNPREEGRSKRVPLGTPRLKLAAPTHRGYVRRWVNDSPGRVEQANNGGYEHVKDTAGGNRREVVGVKEDGSPLSAYLMEVPQEFHDEDQKAKAQEIAKTDDAIKRGNIRGADARDQESYYVSDEGISVRTD